MRRILEATGGRLLRGASAHAMTGVSIDSRQVEPGALYVALSGVRYDGHDFVTDALRRGAGGVLVAAGWWDARGDTVPQAILRRKAVVTVPDPLWALQELARVHRNAFTGPVVAVTGSNGKTTTKEMVAAILERQWGEVLKTEGNFNNYIGLPLTILRLRPRHRAAILEMGISLPGELTRLCEIARPSVGVITTIGPAHLETLGDLAGVVRAKGELLGSLPAGGLAVLPAGSPFLRTLSTQARRAGAEIVTFGLAQRAQVQAVRLSSPAVSPRRGSTQFVLMARDLGLRVPWTIRLPLVGRHHVANALAAAATSLAMGCDGETIVRALRALKPLALRSQLHDGRRVRVFNDAYNANPQSMQAALETVVGLRGNGRAFAVLGDMLELGRWARKAHHDLGAAAARLGLAGLCAVGKWAAVVAGAAKGAGLDRARVSRDPLEAARRLVPWLRPGDIVLLKGSRRMAMERAQETLLRR